MRIPTGIAQPDPIRVVAFMEASTVTGPARNLIRFALRARQPADRLPRVELSVATFCRHRQSNEFIEVLRKEGIEVDIIPENSPFDLTVLARMSDAIHRRHPDIVQTHGVKSHFLMRISGLRRHFPWLGFHHGYTAENFKMRLYNRLGDRALPGARRIVTVCSAFANDLASAGTNPDKISVLPNSIDPPEPVAEQEVSELRARLGIAPGERVVVSIGRFSTEKGHADLIPAAAWLRRSAPELPFRIVLVGEGIERQRVTAAAAAAGLADRFVFAGFHSKVRPFYGLADLFVLPSHSEGSPNVLLEAMAFGVPIAATRVGGVPETVEHNTTALLTVRGDAEALGDAMRRILTDPALAAALSSAGLESVKTKFSPATYRASLTAIYRQEMFSTGK